MRVARSSCSLSAFSFNTAVKRCKRNDASMIGGGDHLESVIKNQDSLV